MPFDMLACTPQVPASVKARDGLALALTHWSTPVPARGVVTLVHGLGEHAGRYAHVARHLNQQGWAVVGYDHRGHGRTPGPRGGLRADDDLLHDLATVVDTARAAYPGLPLAVLGHSMGGLVTARFVAALAEPEETTALWRRPIDLCVLSSPALDLGMSGVQKALLASVGRLTPDVAVGNGLKPEWVCSDASVVKDYVDDALVHDRITGRLTRFMVEAVEVVQARAAHWRVPTLLLYAGSDRCVRPAGAARFAASAASTGRVHTVPFPDMAHEIFNEPDKARVLGELQSWLIQQGPRP
ncbi:alpha/beta hydrolase [Aquabacterium lacunae]|nr:alpha/beta hydrolase [Aquabacterium lacunae]